MVKNTKWKRRLPCSSVSQQSSGFDYPYIMCSLEITIINLLTMSLRETFKKISILNLIRETTKHSSIKFPELCDYSVINVQIFFVWFWLAVYNDILSWDKPLQNILLHDSIRLRHLRSLMTKGVLLTNCRYFAKNCLSTNQIKQRSIRYLFCNVSDNMWCVFANPSVSRIQCAKLPIGLVFTDQSNHDCMRHAIAPSFYCWWCWWSTTISFCIP